MERQILINISQLVTPEGRAAKHGSAMNESKKITYAAAKLDEAARKLNDVEERICRERKLK